MEKNEKNLKEEKGIERNKGRIIHSACAMRELSQKSAVTKLEEHIEETFDDALKKIYDAASEGSYVANVLLSPYAHDNDEVVKKVSARLVNLGYKTKYHPNAVLEISW